MYSGEYVTTVLWTTVLLQGLHMTGGEPLILNGANLTFNLPPGVAEKSILSLQCVGINYAFDVFPELNEGFRHLHPTVDAYDVARGNSSTKISLSLRNISLSDAAKCEVHLNRKKSDVVPTVVPYRNNIGVFAEEDGSVQLSMPFDEPYPGLLSVFCNKKYYAHYFNKELYRRKGKVSEISVARQGAGGIVNLSLENVTASDAGQCQLRTMGQPIGMTHMIAVLRKPEIKAIQPIEKNHTVTIGQPFTLQCRALSRSKPTGYVASSYSWKENSVAIDGRNDRYTLKKDALTINAVREGDSQVKFTCQVTENGGSLTVVSDESPIFRIPSASSAGNQVQVGDTVLLFVKKGDNLQLSVPFDGTKRGMISFGCNKKAYVYYVLPMSALLNLRRLKVSNFSVGLSGSGGIISLSLTNINTSDAGTCQFSIGSRKIRVERTIVVLDKPDIRGIQPVTKTAVTIGQPFTIQCRVNSKSKPIQYVTQSYAWKQNGVSINGLDNRYTLSNDTLTINPVRADDTRLEFTCQVTENGGNVRTVSDESPVYRMPVPVDAPRFRPNFPAELAMEENKAMTVDCSDFVEAKQPLRYLWEDPKGETINGPILSNTKVSRSDSGKYACSVSSGVYVPIKTIPSEMPNAPLSKSMDLKVEYGPVFSDDFPTSKTVRQGEPLTIDCKTYVEAEPGERYVWRKLNGTVQSGTSVLSIKRASMHDAGTYVCTASNILNLTVDGIQLRYSSRSMILQISKDFTFKDDFPTHKSVLENRALRIDCRKFIETDHVDKIVWRKLDGRFTEDSPVLFIDKVRPSHSGIYECVVTTSVNSGMVDVQTHSKSVNITVLYSPVFNKDFPSSKRVSTYDSISVDCGHFVGGNPSPSFMWWKVNGSLIAHSSHLTIQNVTREHSGLYMCSATNLLSQKPGDGGGLIGDSRLMQLFVTHGPNFKKKFPTHMILEKSSPLNVNCEEFVDVYPPASYVWEYPDKTKLQRPILSIPNLSDADSGLYSCTAKSVDNVGGEREKSAVMSLGVVYGPKFNDGFPSNISIEEYEDLTIDCGRFVGANPDPNFTWLKIGGNLVSSAPVLKLNNVAITDSGEYQCTATNILNLTDRGVQLMYTSKSVELKVLHGPKFSGDFPSTKTVAEGDAFSLDCKEFVAASPFTTTSYVWRKDGVALNDLKELSILSIDSATTHDAGAYMCTATSVLMLTEGGIRLRSDFGTVILTVLPKSSPGTSTQPLTSYMTSTTPLLETSTHPPTQSSTSTDGSSVIPTSRALPTTTQTIGTATSLSDSTTTPNTATTLTTTSSVSTTFSSETTTTDNAATTSTVTSPAPTTTSPETTTPSTTTQLSTASSVPIMLSSPPPRRRIRTTTERP